MSGIRIKTDVPSEFVVPKIETTSTAPELITPAVLPNTSVTTKTTSTPSVTAGAAGGGEHWKEFSINIDLSKVQVLVDTGTAFLETLDKIIKITAIILKILKIFNSDLKSLTILLKYLVKVIVKSIKDFIKSLASTGIYLTVVHNVPSKGHKNLILGGFREFKASISQACLNTSDPSTPQFTRKGDVVGGLVIATFASTNNPDMFNNMIKNMIVLSNFFGFENPLPSPPKNFKSTIVFNGNKPHVKLTWNYPDPSCHSFLLCRSTVYDGSPVISNKDPHNPKTVYTYKDSNFNGGKPLKILAVSNTSYTYIDEDVEPDKTYYYQVFSDFSIFDNNVPEITSSLGSPRIKATPRKAIPLSELEWYTLTDVDGNIVFNTEDLFKGPWHQVTVKTLLGNQVNILLKLIDKFGDKLVGFTNTSGGTMDKYIKFLESKIQGYMDILNQIKDIITALMQYRLQGSVLTLSLSDKAGGMENFVKRIMSADIKAEQIGLLDKLADNTPDNVEDENGNLVPVPKSTDPLPSVLDSLTGFFVGVVLLWGYPDFKDPNALDQFVPVEAQAQYKKQMNQLQKSLTVFKKILGLE